MTDDTITVEPEGRDGIWIPDRSQLERWLRKHTDPIHCFIPSGPMVIGADWEPTEVADKAAVAERVALLTGASRKENLNHALAVIADNELFMFDVGSVEDVIKAAE